MLVRHDEVVRSDAALCNPMADSDDSIANFTGKTLNSDST